MSEAGFIFASENAVSDNFKAEPGESITLLHFSLAALEKVEGVGGFGVYVLHDGENIQDVLFGEGRLVTAVKIIFLQQDLDVK